MPYHNEWQRVLQAASALSEYCPDLVFIGGVAVFLHARNRVDERLSEISGMVEFSHDVDAYVTLIDMGALREIQVITPNKRLKKMQADIGGIDIDLYVERQHGLCVPYADLYAHATNYAGLRAASPGHLLALKMDAMNDRGRSPKGEKDKRDIIRLVLVSSPEDMVVAKQWLMDDDLDILDRIKREMSVFMTMCEGNAKSASDLRKQYQNALSTLHGKKPKSPSPRF